MVNILCHTYFLALVHNMYRVHSLEFRVGDKEFDSSLNYVCRVFLQTFFYWHVSLASFEHAWHRSSVQSIVLYAKADNRENLAR